MSYKDGLRQASLSLDPLAALRAPATVLLGVNEPVRDVLASIGIVTVLDLATAPLFALAFAIGEALQGRGPAALSRFDAVPGGAAADGGPSRVAEFAAADLAAIRSLSAAEAASLKAALQVETVGDLGRWIPYRSARQVLDAAGGSDAVADDEASELVPKLGEFPTERRYYSTIVMDRVSVGPMTDLVAAGPVDISPTIAADFGFSAPAIGARVTFQQSWFAHGVTLGNLLHSVALAPGESTRIAVVDWSRQTRASGTESIGETESLTNATQHNRAVSEVQQAVANEVQSGFAHTESTATTSEAGGGVGLGLGPLTLGGSASEGTTTTSGDSFSSSAGSRDLSASMSQQVMDATQQAASSVRNRRASIVKEISETEHESVSTRIIANYNHMHALTVQYYEVIELYRVIVGLHEVERCLFVPMKLIDFDERSIQRFQGVLAAAALTRRARELLTTDFGMIRLTAVAPMRPFRVDVAGLSVAHLAASVIGTAVTAVVAAPAVVEGTTPAVPAIPATPPAMAPAVAAVMTPLSWDPDEVRRASRITAGSLLSSGSASLLLPRDAQVDGVTIAFTRAGTVVNAITLRRQAGEAPVELTRTSIGFRIPGGVSLESLQDIAIATTSTGSDRATGTMSLELSYRGAVFPMTMPIDVAANVTSVVAKVGDSEAGPELIEHLRANRLHYNQAIWRSFDASTVALLLSKFSYEGAAVADLIDPRPIQVAGNYLVFRMPGFVARAGLPPREESGADDAAEASARRAWVKWLSDRGLTFDRAHVQEQLLPVPTGGVFAEAVLGRSNAAEKLDATRFWNWQDSPPPLQPPEIAAINTGSRAQPIDVTPGQLGQPVVNIVTPSSLPDPTGLGAMLGALQNGNMFRDMSGLAATIGLAQGTATNATGAAADAGRLAAANLAVAAQKEVEMAKIAAQVAMASLGAPGGGKGGAPKNISEAGALINAGDKRDQARRDAGGSTGGGGGGGGGGIGGGGASSGGGDGGASGGSGGSTGGDPLMSGGISGGSSESQGDLAFRSALFPGLGVPAGDLVLAKTGGGSGQGAGSGGVGVSGPAQFLSEIFCWSHIEREAGLDTIALEATALANGAWRPSSLDFRAIAIRSSGGRAQRSDAELHNAAEFMALLAEPARRFNFLGYMLDDDTLGFAGAVRPGVVIAAPGTGASDPASPVLGLDTLVGLQEIGGLSSGGGVLGERLRAIKSRNRDFNAQNGQPGAPAFRELWLAVVSDPPSSDFVTRLSKALQMRIVTYPARIVFEPQFKVTPPPDAKRGRVSLGGQPDVITEDLHSFDSFGETTP